VRLRTSDDGDRAGVQSRKNNPWDAYARYSIAKDIDVLHGVELLDGSRVRAGRVRHAPLKQGADHCKNGRRCAALRHHYQHLWMQFREAVCTGKQPTRVQGLDCQAAHPSSQQLEATNMDLHEPLRCIPPTIKVETSAQRLQPTKPAHSICAFKQACPAGQHWPAWGVGMVYVTYMYRHVSTGNHCLATAVPALVKESSVLSTHYQAFLVAGCSATLLLQTACCCRQHAGAPISRCRQGLTYQHLWCSPRSHTLCQCVTVV
jgi:hypothetical protein